MLYYALVFFIIAIIAAVFGFSGLAADAAGPENPVHCVSGDGTRHLRGQSHARSLT